MMAHDVTRHVTTEEFEVCVVGGGLAGVCAALAAARLGARTALVNDRPMLGGNSSSELRVPPSGAGHFNPWGRETGIIHELITEDRARNHDSVAYGHANAIWDLVLYDACRREEALTLFLNTHVTEVTMRDARTVAEVSGVQLRSATTLHLPARVFIDASGDGCVGVGAGVPYRVGPEARGEYHESLAPEKPDDFVMGSSLIFRARDTGHEAPFAPPPWAEVYDYPEGIPYRSTASFAGGYWWIEIGWPLDTLHDDEQIRDELLRHVYGVWDHIKNRGREREQARTWALDWVGFIPARRESRRFVGAHVLTQREVQGGEQFPDTVAYGGWSVDDHTRGGITALDKHPSFDGVRMDDYLVTPYPVPLRCLYANEVNNLFFAGRIMSASRIAFCSLRVQETLAVIGQAAGTAAAYCVQHDMLPHDLTDCAAVQQRLLRDDCYLPGVAEDNLGRDVRGAVAMASSVAAARTEPVEGGIQLSALPAALLPISESRIERVLLRLDVEGGPSEVRLSVHPAENVWDLAALQAEPMASVTAKVEEGRGRYALEPGIEVEPGRLYWFRLEGDENVRWRYAANNPIATAAATRRADGTVWFATGGRSQWAALAINVEPESRPYAPEQAINGLARPGEYVNAWVSDPDEPLPQWLEVELPEPTTFNTVGLIFDTQLSRVNSVTPGLFRAPECVRDYAVSAEVNGSWRELVTVSGNYHRRREHSFEPVTARRVRLTVTATNGDPSARVYALRLYHDHGNDTF